MKILVVDDSFTQRRIMIDALKTIGFSSFAEAEDGKSALDKISHEKFNFIITDWNMPQMSGIELVKAIRSSQKFSKLPILIVTTRASREDILEATKARVNNYIVKPFTAETLKAKLQAIFGAAALNQAIQSETAATQTIDKSISEHDYTTDSDDEDIDDSAASSPIKVKIEFTIINDSTDSYDDTEFHYLIRRNREIAESTSLKLRLDRRGTQRISTVKKLVPFGKFEVEMKLSDKDGRVIK